MSGAEFPSGRWSGFYTYSGQRHRHYMELELRFGTGRVVGEGHDKIGAFVIRGHCAKSGVVSFSKGYIGKHSVSYSGAKSGSAIHGQWEIDAHLTGNFRIWPVGFGDGVDEVETKSEELVLSSQTSAVAYVKD